MRRVTIDPSLMTTAFSDVSVNMPCTEGDVFVWLKSNTPVSVFFVFEQLDRETGEVLDARVHLIEHCSSLNQVYHVPDGLAQIKFAPDVDGGTITYSIQHKGTTFRDVQNPVPKRAIIPMADNSLQRMVARYLDQELINRGYEGRYTGRSYYDADDYDGTEDTEFGPGYAYDPEEERELIEKAAKTVADRYKRTGRLRPSGDSGDKRSAGQPGVEPEPKATPKATPGGDNPSSESADK